MSKNVEKCAKWESNNMTRQQHQQARRRNPGKKRVLNTQRMISFRFIPFIYIPNLNPQIPTHDYPIWPYSTDDIITIYSIESTEEEYFAENEGGEVR